jgi:hypothetical protein
MTSQEPLSQKLSRQRVMHIVSSYQLDREEPEACDRELTMLYQLYPLPFIELALAETIATNWLQVPMPLGTAFFTQVKTLLERWQTEAIDSILSPEAFQQITGLDASPIFQASPLPPSPSIVASLGGEELR